MKKATLLLAVACLCACGATAQVTDGVAVGPNTVCVDHLRNGIVLSRECSHNLKTTWGVDEIIAYIATTLGSTTPIINLSTDSGSPSASDCVTAPCTLAGLITSNGLDPAIGTYAHTSGTNTYTVTHTWTATGSVSSVQKAVMGPRILGVGCSQLTCGFLFENTFTPVTLAANDQLLVTWTITIS